MAIRIKSAGNGRLTRSSRPPQLIYLFSLVSTRLREQNYFAKCVCRPNAKFSSGWSYMADAGPLIVGKDMGCKTMTAVHCALSSQRQLITCSYVAHSPRKFGSDCYVSSVGKLSSLIPSNANLSSGGVVRGRRSRRMSDSALTPLLWQPHPN